MSCQCSGAARVSGFIGGYSTEATELLYQVQGQSWPKPRAVSRKRKGRGRYCRRALNTDTWLSEREKNQCTVDLCRPSLLMWLHGLEPNGAKMGKVGRDPSLALLHSLHDLHCTISHQNHPQSQAPFPDPRPVVSSHCRHCLTLLPMRKVFFLSIFSMHPCACIPGRLELPRSSSKKTLHWPPFLF